MKLSKTNLNSKAQKPICIHKPHTSWAPLNYPPPQRYIPVSIFQYYFSTPCPRRGISLMYSCLSDTRPCSQVHSLTKWAEDLSIPFTQDQWLQAFRETLKASHCTKHRESYHKIIQRWYLTPYRLSKMYPGYLHSCWRNCSSICSIAHTLWFCKSLSSFWNQVFVLISSITGTPLSPTSALALLHIGTYYTQPN